MNFQASQHSNSADSSTALQQGYLQAYQNGEVVKVFAVLSPKSLQLYSEDPSKYPTASLSASIDLSKSKLLEEGNFKRPKSFGVFGEHSFFEFSCATNSSRLSWVKSFQSAKESSESVSKLRGLKATVDFYRAPSAAPARPQPESQPVPPSVPDSRKFTQSSSTQLFGDALGQLRALNSSVSFQQPPHQSQAMQGQASLVAQPKMKKNLIAKPASSSKSSNSASQSKEPPRWIPGNYKTGGQAPPPRNLSPQKPTRTAVAHRDPPQPSLRASSAPNGRTTARQQQQQQQQHQQQHHHQSQSSMYPQEVSSFATPLSLGGHFPGNQPLSVHSLQTPFDHYPGQGYFPSPFSHGPSGGAAPVYRQHPNAHDHGYGQPPMHMPDNRPSYVPPPTTNYPANSAAAAPAATASNVPSSMEHLTLAQIRAALMSIPVPIRSALIEDASREEKPSLSMDRKKPLTASRGGSGGGNGAGGGYKPDKAMPSAGRDRAVTSERYDARYQQMRPSQHRTPEDERGPEDDDSSIDSGYQRHGHSHSHSHSHKKPSKAAAYEQHQHQYRQPFPEEEMLGATTYSDSHFHVRSRGTMGHHETDDDHGGRDDRGGYNSEDGRGGSDNDNDDGDLDDAENDDVNGYGMANMYANSSGSPEIHQTYDGDLTVSGRSNPMTKSQDRHRRSDLFQRSTSLKEAMPSRIPIMEQSRRPNPLQRSRSAPVQRPSTATSGGRAAAATAAAAAAAAAVRTPPSQPSAHLSRSLSKPSHTEPRTDEERESMLDWSKRQARDKRIGANYFGNTKKGAQLVTGQAHAVGGGSRSNSNSPQRRPSTSQTAPSLPIEFAQPLNLRKASAGGTIGPGHGAPKSFFDFKKSSKTADVVATQAPQPPSAGDGRRPKPGTGQPLQPAQQQALEMQLLKYQQELRRKRAEGGPPAATARPVNGADRDAFATTAAAAAPAASSSSATKQKLLEDYHRKRQALLLQSASTPTHDTTAGPTSRTKPSLLAAAASAAAAAAAGTATGAAAGAKGNFYRPTPTAATSIANTAAAVITTTTRPRQFSSESYESVLEDEITDKAEWHRFRSWLESIGMEHYMATMRENGVGKLSVLELLTGNDLAQIGISEDDAAVILHKARELTERIKSFSENVDADDWHVTSTSSRLTTPTSFARRNGGGPSSSYLLNRAAPATPQSVPSMACSTSALPELKSKLVQAYQTGDLDRFFRHWEQLPTFPKLPLTEDFQSQDLKALLRSERPALINAKQAMEFHLHLYFFVYAVKTTAAATATATGGVGGGGGGGVKIAVVKAKAALRKYLERIASLQDDATVAGRGGSGGGVSPGKVASSPSGGGFPLPLRIDPTASPLSPAVKTEPNLSMLGELSPANHTLSTTHAATTATTAAAAAAAAATSSVDYARQLSATREFATFAGMVFVPNPQHNPAFQSLFREEWSVALLERLEKFLDAILPSAAAVAATTSGGDGDGAAVATATATSTAMPPQIARAEEGPAAAAAAAVAVAGAATSAGSAAAVVAGDGGLGEILRPAPVRATDVSVSLQSGTASLKMSQAQDFASSQAAVFGGGGATGSTTSNASQKLPLVPASKVVSASSSFVQPPPPPPAPVPATSTAGSAAMLSGGAVDAAAVAVSETVAVPPTLPVAAVAPVATVGAVDVDVDVSPEVQGITAVAADGLLAGGGEAREVCLSPASSISQLTDDTPLNRVTAALNNHGGGGTSGGAYPHHTMNVWLQSQQQGAAMAGHRPQRAKPTLGSPSPGHSPDRTSSAAAAAAARRPPPGVSSATTGAGIPPTTVLMPLNHRNLLSIQQSQQLQQFQEQFGYAPISPGGSRVSGGGGGGASAGRAETGTPLAATATGVHGAAVRASDLLAVGIDQIDLSPLVSPQTQTVKQPLHVDSPYAAVPGTGADPLAAATAAMPSPSALPPSPTARHAPGSGSGSGGGGAVGRTTAKAATTSAASGATSTSKSSLQAQVDNYNRLLKMKKLGKDVALPTAAAAMPTTPLASAAPQATPQATPQTMPQTMPQATPQATPPSAQWTPPPPQTPPATLTVMSPAAETTGHGGVEAAPTTVADRPVDDAHSSDNNVDEAAAVVAPVAETPSGDAVVAEVADEPLETIDAEDVALAAELTAAADEPVVVPAAEAAVADEAVAVDVPVAAAAAAAPATVAPAVDEPAVDQPADELPEHEADVPAAASLATDEAPSASSSDEAARVESVTDVAPAAATAAVVTTTATVDAEAAESPSEPEPADEPPVTAIVGDVTATVADTVVDTAVDTAAAASGDADTAALDDVFPTAAVSSSGVNPHSHEPQQSVSSSATAASSEVSSSTSSAQQRVEHLMSPEQQAAKYKVLLRSNQKRKKQQQQKAAQQQSSDT